MRRLLITPGRTPVPRRYETPLTRPGPHECVDTVARGTGVRTVHTGVRHREQVPEGEPRGLFYNRSCHRDLDRSTDGPFVRGHTQVDPDQEIGGLVGSTSSNGVPDRPCDIPKPLYLLSNSSG